MLEEVFVSETFLLEPTHDCNSNTLRYILSCLKNAGLITQVTRTELRTLISVRCSFRELCRQAERVHLLKDVWGDLKVRPFLLRDSAKFKHHDDKTNFFTHAQHLFLIERMLHNEVRYSHDELIALGVRDIPLHYGSFVDALTTCEPPLLRNCLPKHSDVESNALWVHGRNYFSVPLAEVRKYFGEDIALYFAFMSYTAHALISLALVGVGFHVWGTGDGERGDEREKPYTPIYGIMASLWGIAYLKCWKRRESELSLAWGTYGDHDPQKLRKDFFGVIRENPVTGKPEIYYSGCLRGVCYFISFLLTLPLIVGSAGAIVVFLNINGLVQKSTSILHVARLDRLSREGMYTSFYKKLVYKKLDLSSPKSRKLRALAKET